MSIHTFVDDYSRQYHWRSWPVVFDAMPNCDGQIVLDLGCGIGDLANVLAMRGARVIGIDANEDFLQFARSRSIKNAEFRAADLRSFAKPNLRVDGIWSSFTAVYFPNFDATLSAWTKCLRQAVGLYLRRLMTYLATSHFLKERDCC
jgi:trans-aconitate methyltransferase